MKPHKSIWTLLVSLFLLVSPASNYATPFGLDIWRNISGRLIQARPCLSGLLIACAWLIGLWRPIPVSAKTYLLTPQDNLQTTINSAQPGDIIQLQAGHYFQPIVIDNISGTANNPIVLEGVPGSKIILDGAYKPLMQPNSLWQARFNIGPGIYSTSLPYQDDPSMWTAPAHASLQDESSLWTYTNLNHLKDASYGFFSGSGIFRPKNQDIVYIRLNNNQNPNQIGVNISVAPAPIYVPNSHYWTFRNLELRHGDIGGFFGRYDNRGITLEDITVISAGAGIYFTGPVYDLTIKGCQLTNNWNPNWWYSDVKDIYPKAMEQSGIKVGKMTQTAEISHCTLTGFFNGLNITGKNLDLHHNTISNILDDGFEPDAPDVNNLGPIYFHHNLMYDIKNTVSLAPAPFAANTPLYIYRNVIIVDKNAHKFRSDTADPTFNQDVVGYGTVFKMGGMTNTPSQNVKIFHNALYSQGRISDFIARDELWHNFEWYNNIFYTENSETIDDSGLASDGNLFNGNLYFRNKSGYLIGNWNWPGKRGGGLPEHNYSSLAAARQFYSGWEQNGLEADPLFMSISARNFQIKSASPARNQAIATPWHNLPGMEPIQDGQPDIGAYEIGQIVQIGNPVPPSQPQTKTSLSNSKSILTTWLTPQSDQTADNLFNNLDWLSLLFN